MRRSALLGLCLLATLACGGGSSIEQPNVLLITKRHSSPIPSVGLPCRKLLSIERGANRLLLKFVMLVRAGSGTILS